MNQENASSYTEILWNVLDHPISADSVTGQDSASRSAVRQLPSTTLVADKSPSLFALIIGINKYTEVQQLAGAVADANAVQEYLESDLKVPKSQIWNLRDEEATRAEILQKLKDLQYHPHIKYGDPIVVFFAGHGSEAEAPAGWEAEGRKIQMILPQNYSSEEGNEVHGITDRSLGVLLSDLAKVKGNNITVVFDCCFSGSGTRAGLTRLDRCAKVKNNLPFDLDHEIFNGSPCDRAIKVAAGFLQSDLRSHVLLAACGAEEKAKEDTTIMRGDFTKAFLETIRIIGADKVSYTELIQRIPQLPEQNPQCEGYYQDRIIFNSKAPSPRRVLYNVYWESEKYIMDAGSAHGITDGAEFVVFKDREMSPEIPPLGILVVLETRAFSTTLDVVEGVTRFGLAEPAFALQTKVGIEEDLRLHVEINERLTGVFQALAQEMQITSPHQRRILLNEKENAELGISLEDGQVVFNILDPLVTRFGLTRMPARVHPIVDDVYAVIGAAAHYRWHLRRSSMKPLFQNNVWMDFKQLTQAREPYGDDLNVDGVIDIVVDEHAMYGIKVFNNTSKSLYPWLFYFDNSDFSITICYQPPTAGKHKVDPPLKERGTLSIGYGSGGAAPFTCYIEEGQNVDVGFFKLFLTTEYVDFSNVAQVAPFRAGGRAGHRVKPKNQPLWDTILVPFVQRRG